MVQGAGSQVQVQGFKYSSATSQIYNFGQAFNSPYLDFIIYEVGIIIVLTLHGIVAKIYVPST